MQRRESMSYPPEFSDLNIMLLGMSGAGKSASGNTILGGDRKTFEEHNYFTPETTICASAHTVVDGQTISVIDTVGLSDAAAKIIQNTHVDVFLLVIKLGETFTKKRRETVKRIQEKFGAKVLKHTIVLFTHGDELHEPIEDYLGERQTLRSLVDQCSGGFHVFNNKDEDRSQVTELLEKIESLRRRNGYRRYTERDYKQTQKHLRLKKCDIFLAAIIVGAAAAVLVGAALRGGAGVLGGGVLDGADVLRGAALGGAGVGEATMMASVAPPTGPAALLGTAECAALLALAAFAGLYFLARKYIFKENGKDD